MVQTGTRSRVELQFADGKVVRLGSNVAFECIPRYLEMVLDSGTLLMSAPKGAKRRAILAGPVVVTGADFQMSNVGGQAKVIGLNGKTLVTTAAGRVGLRPGEMIVVTGSETSPPKATAIDLSKMVGSSELMKMGPVPNQGAIEKNAAKQKPAHTFKVGALSPEGAEPALGIAGAAMQTSAIIAQEVAVAQLLAQQQMEQLAAQQQLETARQQRAAQLRAMEAQIAAQQQARVAREQATAKQPSAASGGQGPQGNQGGGNQGQGNQGGNPNPPGQQPGGPPGQQP